MADTDRIKRNLNKMLSANAPEADMDAYLSSEGYNSAEAWRAAIEPTAVAAAKGREQGTAGGVFPWIDNVVRQVAGGATMGFADEIASGLDAATGRRASYDEALAEARAQDKAFADKNPWTAGIARTVGSVGGALATLPASLTSIGPSLVGNIAKGATVGAGLGGVMGFAEGEGGALNRAQHAVVPAAVGGVLGAALPVVGPLWRSGTEWLLGSRVAPVAERGAVDRLATALQRSGMEPAAVEGRFTELGPGAMLADVDPQFLSMARAANTMPGETRTLAQNVLTARDRETGNRLVGAFEGGERPPSSYVLEQGMDANRRAVGQTAYQGMRDAGLNVSGEMNEMLQVPAVRDALEQITQQAAATGTRLAPVEIMHRVKQMLNLTADTAIASGRPINKADVRTLAQDWENAFWRANPAARQADTAYAQAASLPDYAAAGRSFLSRGSSDSATASSAPALADLLMGANPQQVAAARAGATNAARETALEGTRPARALAQRIDQSGAVQAKLAELYGPPQAASIARRAGTEGVFANTSNQLLRGSQTADKVFEVVGDAGNIGLRGGSSGLGPFLRENLTALAQKLMGPNEAVRNEIGRAMLNPNSEESRRILALAAALLRQRAQGTPIRAGLIEGAAGQAGGL